MHAWATEEAFQQRTWDPRRSRSSSLHWIQHPDSLHLFVVHCHTLAKCWTLPISVPKLTGIDSLRNRFQTSTVLLVKKRYVGTWTAIFLFSSIIFHHVSSIIFEQQFFCSTLRHEVLRFKLQVISDDVQPIILTQTWMNQAAENHSSI